MTGLPDWNYPAFNAAAAMLRERGYLVENPAENPVQPDWLAYMRAAIIQMMRCDMLVMLPGWRDSRGAGIEFDLARTLGLPIHILAENGDLIPLNGQVFGVSQLTEQV